MKLLNSDALAALRDMGEGSVDLIVTDPPYPVISGGEGGRDGRPTGMLAANDGKIFEHNDAPVSEWMPEFYRVLTSPGHCYVMTNLLNLWSFHDAAVAAGFKVHNLLVWHKQNVTPSRWFMKNAEYILFLRKGPARTIYTPGAATVMSHTNPIGNKTHPTEKPVSLMRDLILASSLPGETVLDPFMGSGATGVACMDTGRQFIGIELGREYYDTAVTRIMRMPI